MGKNQDKTNAAMLSKMDKQADAVLGLVAKLVSRIESSKRSSLGTPRWRYVQTLTKIELKLSQKAGHGAVHLQETLAQDFELLTDADREAVRAEHFALCDQIMVLRRAIAAMP